jgi:FG-GAP-like repeat
VSLLFGNGNGTFQAPVTYNLGIPMHDLVSGSLLAADFNGDGKPDLFIKQNQFVGTILLNAGHGIFSSAGAASYQFSELTDYFLGDFNRDGRTDVISVGGSQFFARIALAGPGGTLPLGRAYLLAGYDTFSLASGDFNGDGKPDLVAVTTSSNWQTGESNVLLAKRAGAGIFRPPFTSITGDVGTGFVATADLNHDGILDLVMASSGGISNGSVNVHFGRGNGTFQKPVSYPAVGPTSIAIADFNGDGIPDLAVNSGNLFGSFFPGQILLGNGEGTFRSGPGLPTGIRSLVAADFNHDGKQDLAVGALGGVGIMLGNGDGTFQPISVLHKGQSGSLVLADFNNDGELDVAAVGTGTLGTVVSVYLGDGKGAISWAHNTLINTASGLFPIAATADFDADGSADIAVTIGHGIAVARGKGTGYFRNAFFYPTGAAGGLVAADLDGNGTPDLALTTEGQNSVVVLLNQP